MTSVEFISPALAEIADATNYYLEPSPEGAAGFLAELDHAVDLLADNPMLGRPTDAGARRLTLVGYPFDVVYRIHEDRVIVNAVAHHRREPRYWIKR